MSYLIIDVLKVFKDGKPMSPGDVAQRLGIPKYKALSVVSCLSEIGLLEAIYSKGNYKIYKLSDLGEAFLVMLEGGRTIKDLLEAAVAKPNAAVAQEVRQEVRAES
ncbi:MAG: transcriptional regulator [Acidilobus sp.]